MSNVNLCIHGHFYQPPRQSPVTGAVEREPAAAPYHDFDEKIWDECYRPNAEEGNFARMSYNLGPTLAEWLAQAHPETLRAIVEAGRANHARDGHGNALAQAYHHVIMPLATPLEKRIQVAWGVRDFQRRYGYRPEGLWLPETAADDETLDELARQGLAFTVLAPWQAAPGAADPSEPYRVPLPGGRSLAVFFYNAPLSGDVSFDDETTADAARFCERDLAAHVDAEKSAAGIAQLILVATDGELYGHHKRFRDLFLARLLEIEAPARGFTVTSLAGYLAQHPPTRETAIQPRTSWSCAHGVARWDEGCTCTAGDSSWKRPLRQALRALAARLDHIFLAETAGDLRDPWAALEEYIDLRHGVLAPAAYWGAHARRDLPAGAQARLGALMEMQAARHAMFVSCAWFFEDLDRLEPRIALRYARHAITLAGRLTGADLEPDFLSDLVRSLSLRTGRSAADLYLTPNA